MLASSYLDEHGLIQYLQGLLQSVLREKPADPYAYMIRQLQAAQLTAPEAEAAAGKPAFLAIANEMSAEESTVAPSDTAAASSTDAPLAAAIDAPVVSSTDVPSAPAADATAGASIDAPAVATADPPVGASSEALADETSESTKDAHAETTPEGLTTDGEASTVEAPAVESANTPATAFEMPAVAPAETPADSA